ncbi:MAG: Ni/Fe hydrogenase subunit alpha [Thermodesulfobacteriota bacterium]
MTRKKNLVLERARSYVTKIEGHGSLEADFKKGSVKLHAHEGERLFEGILVGRTLEEMQWITPRICGVCPIAHNLASLKAAENALGIKVSKTTRRLRRLMQVAQNVQSHVLHAVFLALPDYIGIDRITELYAVDPETFTLAISLKDTGDEIARVIAGRSVHPTRSTVGGFHRLPAADELKGLRRIIKKSIPGAKKLAGFFSTLEYPGLSVDLEHLAQVGSEVVSSKGRSFGVTEYKEFITEEVRSYSTAKFGSLKGGPVMVGALARLYFRASEEGATDPLLKKIDFNNPFYNNPAQAIEVYLELEDGVRIIDELLSDGMDSSVAAPATNPPLKGIGAVEAPRGGLYNEVHIKKDGQIKYANIVTPTVQNLTTMEYTAEALLKARRGEPRKDLCRLLEMLVRAFDPCITCSTH